MENNYLAPNGKPTNLTPEQYKLVRTKAFKQWFGDWEKDPSNASKVVDENGEPLVVYHATNNEFNVFDFNKADIGFHFGTYEQAKNRLETKSFFQGNKSIISAFFLSIKNIYQVSDIGNWEYPQRYLDMFMSNNIISENEFKKNSFQFLHYKEDNKKIRKFLIKKYKDKIGFEYNNKYEGKGKSYIVIEPNQIKLADGSNTTFDSNNNDIRFAKGGLIAPNGQVSNLTPEQYKLVRTKAFKEWFGDWENDPENASKVVDENGEPLVVYHGTKYDFNIFKMVDKVQSFNVRDYGSYFTDNKKTAQLYSLDYTTKKGNAKIVEEKYQKALNKYFKTKNEIDLSNARNLLKESSELSQYPLNSFVSKNILNCFLNLRNPLIFDGQGKLWSDVLQGKIDLALKNKNDGAIIKNISEVDYIIQNTFITFEPEQIKLADGSNTTFDGNNTDIRFEQGGGITYRQYVDSQFNEEENRYLPSDYFEPFEIETKNLDDYPILLKTKNDLEYRKWKYGGIGVFNGNKRIAFADNGSIQVSNEYQGKGIGLELVVLLKEINPNHRFGNMTPQGRSLMKKYYDTKIANNPDIRFVDGGKVDSFGKVEEVIINPTEITCHRCYWHWKVKDGGYDLFICHNCNYDNTKYYKFEGKEGERILATMSFKEGGKASKIDSNELKMEKGGIIDEKYQNIVDEIKNAIIDLRLPYLNDVDEFNRYYLSKSKSDFGQSWYMIFLQRNRPLEIRISDHSVTSSSRILDNKYIAMLDVNNPFNHQTPKSIAKSLDLEFKLLKDISIKRNKLFDIEREKRDYMNNKLQPFLDKLKSENKSIGKNDKTYQTLEDITTKHPDWEYVYYYPNNGAFSFYYVKKDTNGSLYPNFINEKYFAFLNDNGYLHKMEKGGELAKGIRAESEHKQTIEKFKKKGVSVNDIAKSIALDHIKEDSKYYTKLEKMEKTKFDDGGGVGDSEMNEILQDLERSYFQGRDLQLIKDKEQIQNGRVMWENFPQKKIGRL